MSTCVYTHACTHIQNTKPILFLSLLACTHENNFKWWLWWCIFGWLDTDPFFWLRKGKKWKRAHHRGWRRTWGGEEVWREKELEAGGEKNNRGKRCPVKGVCIEEKVLCFAIHGHVFHVISIKVYIVHYCLRKWFSF